jgi:hypothetical protein
MLQVNTDAEKFGIDIQLSAWKAGQILDTVAAKHPKVRDVFHTGIEHVLSQSRTLYNCFGRRRVFYNRWDHMLVQEGLAYIPQSTVRDQMLKLMIQFRKDYPNLKKKICIEAHDAFVVICPYNLIAEVHDYLKNWCNTNLIDFSRCSLPRDYMLKIPCDVEIGEVNYKELVKYRKAVA